MKRRCRLCGDPCVQKYCAACAMVAEAHRKPSTPSVVSHSHLRQLAVACWCERTTVWVLHSRLLAGRTESCGLPECRSAA